MRPRMQAIPRTFLSPLIVALAILPLLISPPASAVEPADRAAGVLHVPCEHPVYAFVERLHTKGFLPNVPLGTRPWTRMSIADALSSVDRTDGRLTANDSARLAFFCGEFADELHLLGRDSLATAGTAAWWTRASGDSLPAYARVLAAHGDDRASYRLQAGLAFSARNDTAFEQRRTARAGGWVRMGKHWGAQAYMTDVAESGDHVVPPGQFGREQGVAFVDGDTSGAIYYDDPIAEASYGSELFTVTLGTMPVVFGTASDGNIVLSGNAPPVPCVWLTVHPWPWLTFSYLHMSLQSGVPDSGSIWQRSAEFQNSHLRKYYVAHRLEYSGIDGVNLAVGESIIYGGRGGEVMYLIPVVPFRAAQHDVGDLDNLQMWADFSVASIPWTRIHGAIMTDELRISTMFDEEANHNWWIWQIGVQVADLWGLAPDVDLALEYTRANPWIYHHRYAWNTYDTWAMRANEPIVAYPLGFWQGHNGDVVFGRLTWRALRDLELSAWARYARRGSEGNVDIQYDEVAEPFLFGEVTRRTEAMLEGRWEVARDLVLSGGIGYGRVAPDDGETESWFSGRIGISYGLPGE